ncbi:hypothetical protein QE152_g20816 [Popillia japonica]|uniref:Uncharacterized protein n=1 Tax=Popillia japonica TaxID=7064 RepID=A0AAW1KNA0_POPJA
MSLNALLTKRSILASNLTALKHIKRDKSKPVKYKPYSPFGHPKRWVEWTLVSVLRNCHQQDGDVRQEGVRSHARTEMGHIDGELRQLRRILSLFVYSVLREEPIG